MNRLGCCLAVVLVCALRAPAADPASLEDRIGPIAREHKGKIAVAVKNLRTGEEYYLNADEPMTTASLIKLSVMVETYWQAEEGKVSLDKMLKLTQDDKVPGAGVLTDNFTPGATFAPMCCGAGTATTPSPAAAVTTRCPVTTGPTSCPAAPATTP